VKVLITGGGGFLGQQLARSLLAHGKLSGQGISTISLLDAAYPANAVADARLRALTGDISDPEVLADACPPDTGVAFHLAAVVSGAAEADFDLGMRVNLEGTRLLLEQLRRCAKPPRLVFASSVAAFGGTLPDVLDDSTTPTPQTSYGTQKVIGEYLVSDYARKGFIDGRSLRLPTIVVRAGKPNAAASSFASGIIREPLNGVVSQCPVSPETGVWLLSPGKVTEAFLHASQLPPEAWGTNRVVNLPGLTATVREMVAALSYIGGTKAASLVKFKPDPRIQRIVETWPVRFRTPRALSMGFKADDDFESVVSAYIFDEQIRLA